MPKPTIDGAGVKERQFSLVSLVNFSVPEEGDVANPLRNFSGVAYSGEIIRNHYFWGNVIFDLTSMSVPERLPVLLEHDREKRVGYVTNFSVDDSSGFVINGKLLRSKHGKEVASDSDDQFPWRMSMHIDPDSVEEVPAGRQITVNGRPVIGPCCIFRNSTVSEVSFTSVAWDPNTNAVALSKTDPVTNIGENTMTLEEALAQITSLNAELAVHKQAATAAELRATTAENQVLEFSKAARLKNIETLYASLNKPFDAASEDVTSFSKLDEASFNAMATFMRQSLPQSVSASAAPADPNLFSHQATNAGRTTAPAADSETNPLLADAKKRSQQFSKMHAE